MSNFRRNIAANLIGNIWNAGAQILFVPLYIHYMGLEAYGLIGFYTSLQLWLSMADFGLAPTLCRESARALGVAELAGYLRRLFHTLDSLCLAIGGVIILLVGALAYPIAHHWLNLDALDHDDVFASVAWMGVVIAGRWMTGFYRGGLLGLQRQMLLNGLQMTFTTLRCVGVLGVLMYYSTNIKDYFIYQAVVSVAEAVCMRIAVSASLPKSTGGRYFDFSLFKQQMEFAGGMTSLSILGVLLTQSDKMLLSRLLPLAEFSYYALAASIANALVMLASPIVNATYPRLIQSLDQNRPEETMALYHRGTRLVAIATVPFAWAFLFFGKEIIFVWSNNVDLAAATAPLATILVAGSTLHALMHMPCFLQLAHAWTRLSVVVNTISLLVLVPAILVLVPRHGAMAAAYAWLALNCAWIFIQLPIAHARLAPGQNRAWYGLDVAVPALAALAVLGCGYAALRDFGPWLFASRWNAAAVIGALGLVAMAAAALASRMASRPSKGREPSRAQT